MKYYLSSFGLGNKKELLKSLTPKGKIGYIPNARDYPDLDLQRHQQLIEKETHALRELGLEVEVFDLKKYFKKDNLLKKKLLELGAIFVSGGNVFILRQAMKLSGLDLFLTQRPSSFLYAGYSAGGCVLFSNLRVYEKVDPILTPYPEQKEALFEGLGLLDWALMPHWRSNHPESIDIEKAVLLCQQKDIPYKALKDGEVILIDS